MGTSGLLAVKSEVGVVGPVLNFDAYPENVVPQLSEIIARDGIAKAAETILSVGCWRDLDAKQSPAPDTDHYFTVEGYGEGYSEEKPLTALERWEDAVTNVFLEYGYLLDVEAGTLSASCFVGGKEVPLSLEEYLPAQKS